MYETDANYFKDKKYVICNTCAFARNGLSFEFGGYLNVLTDKKEMHAFTLNFATFTYESSIDYVHFVSPTQPNENLLLPTKERAIVEAIKHLDTCPEGDLITALKMYMYMHPDTRYLYSVAEFFKLDKDILDHWITEAKNDGDEN